ncbi:MULTISPECIES: hypothetical protein [unclassified Brevundimonas]|uniref:hypothetical protein n=1 Tax=unclassified Brevundimonas TaxID=2622653 RepID=UPI0025C512F0|nr:MULTISPECIES: hypothetical protein [unclassified Brevundimonas]
MPALNADSNKGTARQQDLMRLIRRAIIQPVGADPISPQDVIDAAQAVAGKLNVDFSNLSVTGQAVLDGKALSNLSNLQPVNYLLGGPLITFDPVGNGWPTKGHFHLLFDDTNESVSVRQFDFALGANYSKGTPGTGGGSESGPGDEGGKVLLYGGVNMRSGCYKAWTMNLLMHLDTGVTPEFVNIVEFDIDNHSGSDFGAGIGAAGIAAPSVYGVTVNGGNPGNNTVTAGHALLGSGMGPIYERGYMVGPGSTKQAAYDDYSNATASYRDLGNHAYGADFSGTYSALGVRLPNGVSYGAKRADNTNASLAVLDASNNLRLGETGVTDIFVGASIYPNTDNQKAVGGASQRFTTIYLANNPTVSSDPMQKTGMTGLSEEARSAVFERVSGYSYRFKVGGTVPVVRREPRLVQASEIAWGSHEVIEVVDGIATRRIEMVKQENLLWDEAPLLDEQGNPVMHEIRELDLDDAGQPRMIRMTTPKFDEAGNPVIGADGRQEDQVVEVPAKRKRMVQQTYRIPRMVEKEVDVEAQESRPGRRQHFGFDASEWAKIGEDLGCDFGGYVEGDGGEMMIRPDYLLPFLWEEVKALRAKVAALNP